MKILRPLFDFYINSSIHVAVAVLSLVLITNHLFHNPFDLNVIGFAFFGTIVGYNFVKYESLFINKKPIGRQLKAISFLSAVSFVVTVFCFFKLELITQIVAVVFLGLTLLYTVPFFPNRKNARNWAGVKIYMVTLCWVGVTVVLPVLNGGIEMGTDFFVIATQRFLLIFALILIFEIIDLAKDDPYLQTVPQQIGVKQTKILGYVLLIVFCGLEILNINGNSNINDNINFQPLPFSLPLIFAIAIVIVTALFLAFANEKRPKYYTSFWVESIPVFWWLMIGFCK
jgi:hypothetical protein